MSRFAIPLVIVVALILFLHLGLQHGDPRALPSPFIGKPAPEFELPTLKNPEVNIGSENGLKKGFRFEVYPNPERVLSRPGGTRLRSLT